ncbi:GNAT family N-acetyltransferase [Flammeovirga sp. MY04]|uniref:GNAT family N-acetyltransferase n=1 Tax=Flammeovirga sp. MY04 TaxID=1191459 RepID=UPI0008061B3A|nr:GNAT family N-acetyltransferase [Flammeovirga sp. MY04]ANQ48250.1 GNAT family N-acetyltransferase [Flammeovirga sp. MY04]
MYLDLLKNCSFGSLTKNFNKLDTTAFDCNNDDLNDFFINDAVKYSKDLLGKTYVFVLDTDKSNIVCMFTVSNDSLKAEDLPNSRKKKVNKNISRQKQKKSYPAVLIGRLGVSKEFIGKGIGTQLMDFIKAWFLDPTNKTGCRFLVVDAYNQENAISYYLKNGFLFLFSTELQEKEYMNLALNKNLNTRMMYFDLLSLEKTDEQN